MPQTINIKIKKNNFETFFTIKLKIHISERESEVMLLPMPEEMLNNPKCYRLEKGIGYVPTEGATEHEAKVVREFNLFDTKVYEKHWAEIKENLGL